VQRDLQDSPTYLRKSNRSTIAAQARFGILGAAAALAAVRWD
jgi:hypothetical protein